MVVLLVVLLTIASYAVGWVIGLPALLPLLNALPAWLVMARELRAQRVMRAIGVMLVWAATMAVAATSMAALGLRSAGEGDLFVRAAYREEMLQWVRTGVGPESQPSVFIPRHLASAGLFGVAAVGTGGLAAMPMGAVLTNSMGDYVGSLARQSAHPVAVALIGWHPWAVVRVIAFVILGVLLSGLSLSWGLGVPFEAARYTRWWIGAVAMLGLDIGLKWLLAPAWGQLLRGLVGW